MSTHLHDLVYYAALSIVIGTCVGAVLHPRVHTGAVGSAALAGIALFTLAAFDYEPNNWRMGQMLCAAAFCVSLVARFWWRRAKMKQRLLRLCNACPLHEE